jgi:hypothetical protein
MSNKLQKTLAYQEKVNNAVKKLIEDNPELADELSAKIFEALEKSDE